MKYLKMALLSGLIMLTNGCTVLGLAADLAIISASDNEKQRNSVHKKGVEPFFTQEGLKHDIAFLKQVMIELPNNELQSDSKEGNQLPILACKNVVHGKQQCYPPEYYKEMYIKKSSHQQADTISSKQ